MTSPTLLRLLCRVAKTAEDKLLVKQLAIVTSCTVTDLIVHNKLCTVVQHLEKKNTILAHFRLHLSHIFITLKDPSKPLISFLFSLLCGSLICCLFVCCFFFSWQASPTDEAIALLLFEWAVSKYRVGKFRALAVAKILQRRQTELVEEVRLLIRVLRLWVQFFFCSTQK